MWAHPSVIHGPSKCIRGGFNKADREGRGTVVSKIGIRAKEPPEGVLSESRFFTTGNRWERRR